MSKIEKTLELNITHEILRLADSFWYFLYSTPLDRHWHPHRRIPIIAPPKTFASGLHINLEGKAGGGYDVCINSPANFAGGSPRLLFMQFKAGVEKSFNMNPDSLFYGDITNPKVHVEFDINSNTKNDQHELLQRLAKSVGKQDAVVYVFPRMVNIQQLQDNLGKLLSKTSFISIAEMDIKAAENGVTIADKSVHKFRTCYEDHSKNEVNFFFFIFGAQNKPGGLLGEIFAIRMYRALNLTLENHIYMPVNAKSRIADAMILYILHIGQAFSIPLKDILSFVTDFPYFANRIDRYFEPDIFLDYNLEDRESESMDRVFYDIVSDISPYFAWVELNSSQDIYNDEIPAPPANYTVELNQEGLRLDLDLKGDNIMEDLEAIFYNLL